MCRCDWQGHNATGNPLAAGTLVGTSTEVTDDIKRCEDLGIHQVTFDFRTAEIEQCLKVVDHLANAVVSRF